jgi:hypothetical protein
MHEAQATGKGKAVSQGSPQYLSMLPIWKKCRAVLEGEQAVKDHDQWLDTVTFENLLIPFSPTMTQKQYHFYKAEAELPGLASQYARILNAGLLRKAPSISFLSDKVTDEMKDWVTNDFCSNKDSIHTYLSMVVEEELQTSAGWTYVDLPNAVEGYEEEYFPYPVFHRAENVINYYLGKHPKTCKNVLLRFVTRYFVDVLETNQWHPDRVEEVRDHYLDEEGYLVVDVYRGKRASSTLKISQGSIKNEFNEELTESFDLKETYRPLKHGKRFDFIPAFPNNGWYSYRDPTLLPIVLREIHLYNKMSRRNHLMYGAATFTPYITGPMDEDAFSQIVNSGLGAWLHLPSSDNALKVLETPTSALSSMEESIRSTVEDLHRMGIRILSPEGGESGIALEIRNASQTVQLSSINTNISKTMSKIITLMLNWKYDKLQLKESEVQFQMSTDFNPSPIGQEWLRLITHWYESRHISRSTFIRILQQNDILPADHNDELELQEIQKSPLAGIDSNNVVLEDL